MPSLHSTLEQQGLTHLLRFEKIRAEMIIASLRCSFFAGALSLHLMSLLIQRRELGLDSFIIVGALAFSILAIVELRMIRSRVPLSGTPEKRLRRLGHIYYTMVILFDAAIISAYITSAYRTALDPASSGLFPINPVLIFAGGFLVLTMLYLVLDIFRFSTATTIYSSAVFISAYFVSAALLDINHTDVVFRRSTVVYLAAAALTALLAGLISREIFRITVLSKRQQQLERFLPQAQTLNYIHSANALLPGGEKQTITILFADIRGFSTMSEQLSPLQTIEFLNEYFSRMVNPIFDNHGILDKYIGDGIMALFGAPYGGDSDADNAVKAALEMQQQLLLFNRDRLTQKQPEIQICIGIHTGEVILGNIGTERRLDYTAIGDSVNTAARLEQLNRKLGTSILISSHTRAALSSSYSMEDLGHHLVKGRNGQVHIFSLR
ncbi:MAG: adenylate/guanylate cyclase domain-containing protein [Spirochaeta sp.]